jgi:pimeloyl-ACP methyl ester carboxylesterase
MDSSRRAPVRSLIAGLVSMAMVMALTVAAGAPAGASAAGRQAAGASAQVTNQLPIVFVHGYLGSGAQYRSQAMRFDSNGYPASRIRAFDYSSDSSGLDAFIDSVRQEFGVSQVRVAAHSLGTLVMLGYLLNPFQAAKVQRYVALDGVSPACIWGTQCTSITAASLGQTHIEASLSPESFARQYQFFTGTAPATTNITPQSGTIQIAGRALNFQVNTPATGVTGELWAINQATGFRTGASPQATFTIGANGNFGPLNVTAGQAYEIALTRPGVGLMHYYYQPFTHSTYLLRLQVPQSGSPQITNTNVGPNHAAAVALRYREWWRASGHGTRLDNLDISTPGQPTVNALSRVTADIAGVHVHDNTASPRQSTLDPLSYWSSQPFQTGVDVYMPGASPANATITFANNPRGDATKRQTINTPNWASMVGTTRHAMLVEFNDYFQ